jgi:hypothetical protein
MVIRDLRADILGVVEDRETARAGHVLRRRTRRSFGRTCVPLDFARAQTRSSASVGCTHVRR